jgi:sulfite exporter TauE/SafE
MIINLFIYGLLFGSGPCLASCGPLLISYIAGTNKKPLGGLRVYILFSFSRILAYIVINLLIFFLGKSILERLLRDYSTYIYILGGVFIIVVGLLMSLGKSLSFKPWQFLQRSILEHDFKSIFVFGLIIGFLPCVPLLAILSSTGLIAKTWLDSLCYAFSFGLGTVVSILLPLTFIASFLSRLIADKSIYGRVVNLACGIVIIMLGVQLVMSRF